MDILNIKKNHLLVSRAATGIFLVLDNRLEKGSKVLVPANLCYAAIYPIIYSGNTPLFCDVEYESGNISLNIVKKYIDDINAIIIPHMYGNPVQDIKEIVDECHKKNILVIEDCASSMGATIDDIPCGSFGDYIVFSTGYSKTLDVGGGGILLSNNSLEEIKDRYHHLNLKEKNLEEKEKLYSKLYREIRNGTKDYENKEWLDLNNNSHDLFIYLDKEYDDLIIKNILNIDEVVKKRNENLNLYNEQFKDNKVISKYKFNKESSPWRFCFFIDKRLKKDFVDYLLRNNVPISDWYPNVTPIFGDRISFRNIDKMEEKILNLPLLIDQKEIEHICCVMNSFELR